MHRIIHGVPSFELRHKFLSLLPPTLLIQQFVVSMQPTTKPNSIVRFQPKLAFLESTRNPDFIQTDDTRDINIILLVE